MYWIWITSLKSAVAVRRRTVLWYISLSETFAVVTEDIAIDCFFFSNESTWRSPWLFLWVGKCHKYSVNVTNILLTWVLDLDTLMGNWKDPIHFRTSPHLRTCALFDHIHSLCTFISYPLIPMEDHTVTLGRFSLLCWSPYSAAVVVYTFLVDVESWHWGSNCFTSFADRWGSGMEWFFALYFNYWADLCKVRIVSAVFSERNAFIQCCI